MASPRNDSPPDSNDPTESLDGSLVTSMGPPQEQMWGRRRRQPREEQPAARPEITEEELRRELALLGFSGIPRDRLLEFKQDLEELMERRAGLIPGPEGDMARGGPPGLTSETSPSSSDPWSDENAWPDEAWGLTEQQREAIPTRDEDADPEPSRAATANTGQAWADLSPWQAPGTSQPPSRGTICAKHSRGNRAPEWSPHPVVIPQSDSYSKHTVAIGRRWPSATVTSNTPRSSSLRGERLVPLPSSPGSSSSSSQDAGVRRPVMKRKVLRRRQDGQTQVSDESIISETDSGIWEHRAVLQGEHGTDSDSLSSDSLPDRWIQRPADWDRHKSFIRPRMEPLINGYRKRTDPVAKYMQYKQSWDSMQVSVDKGRRELRWGIREQMLYKTPQVISRPPQVYVPNDYVVPTEKKRYALRWGVRYDLVNGIIPQAN
ncbi:centriolar and ciliogenesis-associated protein HYLS1 [Ambystoma mexicanum]|uniref:centriolar and ciliogenesis-associated protein HYLS1 n=1 Tax=Ambystoma mexicanum TaxID=8296 RepID=UPI0037E7283B